MRGKCPVCAGKVEIWPERGRPRTYCTDACARVAFNQRRRQRRAEYRHIYNVHLEALTEAGPT